MTKVTRTTVSLKWSAPLNDGGSPIVGYIIERKPYTLTGEGRWLKCNYTNVTDTFYTVTALGEGEPYEFRVIAKNANQVFSLPSVSTGSVQCKTDFGELRIASYDEQQTFNHKLNIVPDCLLIIEFYQSEFGVGKKNQFSYKP